MDISNKCKASINPDKHPMKNKMVSNNTTLISLCELHITINATKIMYMLIPIDERRFSAMKTSENVPSESTSANIIPTAKKHKMTNQ